MRHFRACTYIFSSTQCCPHKLVHQVEALGTSEVSQIHSMAIVSPTSQGQLRRYMSWLPTPAIPSFPKLVTALICPKSNTRQSIEHYDNKLLCLLGITLAFLHAGGTPTLESSPSTRPASLPLSRGWRVRGSPTDICTVGPAGAIHRCLASEPRGK